MTTQTPPTLGQALNRWFRTPPRLHGEVDTGRTVSFLELFYDLVYVVLVAQIAHHLAAHVTWEGVLEFVIVFGMVWLAWMNGSLYHEVHGREDGRHRSYIFGQMFLLMVLAVFAGEATGEGGRAFALTYVVLLSFLFYMWWVVYRHDTIEVFRRAAARYLVGLGLIIAAVAVSAFVDEHWRLWIWAGTVAFAVGSFVVQGFASGRNEEGWGVGVTESMVERFGLFTIIVLGEVVVGVTNGIIEAGASTMTIVVGLLAMTVGFGFWWNYFDVLGRQLPYASARSMVTWVVLHLPLHGTIAAAGAGMVTLITHSADDHLEPSTTWLLVGSTAGLLVLISALVMTIDYPAAVANGVRTFQILLWVGAAACIGIGFLPLPAWGVALALSLLLGAMWWFAFYVQTVSAHHAEGAEA